MYHANHITLNCNNNLLIHLRTRSSRGADPDTRIASRDSRITAGDPAKFRVRSDSGAALDVRVYVYVRAWVRACVCETRAVVSRTAAGRRRETKRREAWERNSQREHKAADAPFPAASRRLPTLAYTCHVTWPTREIRPTTRCDASRRAMRESWENSKMPPDRVQLGAYLWIGFHGGF